jgi:hypothetical protein
MISMLCSRNTGTLVIKDIGQLCVVLVLNKPAVAIIGKGTVDAPTRKTVSSLTKCTLHQLGVS